MMVRTRWVVAGSVACALMLRSAAPPVAAQAATRTAVIEVSEVTAPALALAPDERTLVFSALGHLYQLPTEGGRATQLTFGPSYDTDPVFAPEGRRLAFASNRDGSSSNIFVLDLESRQVTQLTHEVDATRPAWSPDGRVIAFARTLAREDHPFESLPGFADTALREVMTIPASGGPAATAASPRGVETVFYLADGRLAWSVRDMAPGGGMFQTVKQSRIEARTADGVVAVLGSAAGEIGRVAASAAGDAVYFASRGALQRLVSGAEPVPLPGVRLADAGTRLASTSSGRSVYFADRGQLWRVAAAGGDAARIPFTATMTMEFRPRVERSWQPPPTPPASASAGGDADTAGFRAVLAPHVSPDGTRLVLIGGGFVWEQPLSGGGAARRVIESGAFIRDPAYSPDGRRLAFVASEHGRRELRVYDFGTRASQTLFAVGGASWPLHPAWSPDGSRIVFQHTQMLGAPFRIVVVTVADGTTQEVAQTVGSWVARPHFAGDGRAIYFTNRPGRIAGLYRLALEPNATPELLTDLTRHVHEGLVSRDGQWMAYRRNSEIWVAPMGTASAGGMPIRDPALARVSGEGGRAFSFTPDSRAIVYAAGGRVFRQPLDGDERIEIPVRLSLPRAVIPPLLITRVRALDFGAGAFTGETSIFAEGGRIRWIGSEQGRTLPAGTVRIDGAGKFAIPGLFDTHVHSAWANQQANEDAFIAFGVTSVRDTGSSMDLLTALDDRSDLTPLPAPRYFYSGEIFEGTMPHWGDAFYTVRNESEVRAEVRNLKAWGADFVKVYPSLPWHLQQVMADEAHRAGLPIVGHGLSLEETTRRVLWGSTSLEHGGSILNTYQDVHKLLAASGVAADLTLSVGGGSLMRASDPDWRGNWRVTEFVPEEARRAGQGGGGPNALGTPDQPREQLLELFKPRFQKLMTARGLGVGMTGGTDALMGGVFFGLSLHWEIAQMADAGIPPLDVLRIATEGGAALVGATADLGSLAPGKLADILLLEANPLEDIRHTQRIWQVVKGGIVHDPATLRPRPSPRVR